MEQFLPFKEALVYARSWKLEGKSEWEAWAKSSARPANVPSRPETNYKHDGWQGYGHWLGTGNYVQNPPPPPPLSGTQTQSTQNGNATQGAQGVNHGQNPPPPPPSSQESQGMQQGTQNGNTCNVLGGKNQHRKEFLRFKEALLHARSLKLKGRGEWREWHKTGARPANVPSRPDQVYKHDGWQGWGHWLGTGNVGVQKDHQFLPFKEALLYARSLKLKNKKVWEVWRMTGVRPDNVPSHPDATYKHDGWQGWGHWLGTGNVAPKDHQFLPFKKALLYARSLKLKCRAEWVAWSKSGARPANVPSRPDVTYKHDGWQGYGHWLGTDAVAPKGH